jgi:D-alanyl-D-alanine carboxypeptidase (penicillin-binding protein 5/6)
MDDAGRKDSLTHGHPTRLAPSLRNAARTCLTISFTAALALSATISAHAESSDSKRSSPKKAQVAESQAAEATESTPAPSDGAGGANAKGTAEAAAKGPAKPEAAEQTTLELAARGAVVIDTLTGKILYAKSPGGRFFPASATKILTALLVIERGGLDQPVVIEPVDTKVEPSAIGFKPGESFTRRELLFALMLKSANDSAKALARDHSGSVAAFANAMTERARQLGATDSQFMNPHGLHHPKHFSTPYDLAVISRAAMQQPLFRQIVATQFHPFSTPQGSIKLRNHNKLLWKYPGCTGLKTGYTVAAQQVLVSSALRNSREVISVVMHTDKPGIWEDSKRLLSYGLLHLPTEGGFLP